MNGCNLKFTELKRIIIFQTSFFGLHDVSFPLQFPEEICGISGYLVFFCGDVKFLASLYGEHFISSLTKDPRELQ